MSICIGEYPVIPKIVRCIVKAVSEDVPEYLRENGKETNNATLMMRSDCINENLRVMVIEPDIIDFVPFKRYLWQGRLIADRTNKISYSITTSGTLRSITRKQRTSPHFLQSVLYAENGDIEAMQKQQSLFNIEAFDGESLTADYNSIVCDLINSNEGYKHFVICYDTDKNSVTAVSLEFLDKDFDVIESISLNEFILPNVSALTEEMVEDGKNPTEEKGTVKSLLHVKQGLRPKLRDIPEQA